MSARPTLELVDYVPPVLDADAPEGVDPIAYAARLVDLGCTVLACPPAPDIKIGYALPKGWQRRGTGASSHRIWRDGWALILVTGVVVDVVDVDPRSGGDVDAVRALLRAEGVDILGEHATPSGGAHFVVAATGRAGGTDRLGPGVDVKAGRPDGTGKGFVFLPGTWRTSKTTGEVGPYVVTAPVPADLDAARLQPSEGLRRLLDEAAATGAGAGADRSAEYGQAKRQHAAAREATASGSTPSTSSPGAGGSVTRLPSAAVADELVHAAAVLGEVAHLAEGEHPPGADGRPIGWEDPRRVGMCIRLAELKADGHRVKLPGADKWPAAFRDYVRGKIAAHLPAAERRRAERGAAREDRSGGTAELEAADLGGRTAAEDRPELTVVTADSIRPRRATWLWDKRVPAGALALLAGRGGLGKSTVAYWLAARITRGELPGVRKGRPACVVVVATEDAWEEIIIPRLMAAEADLSRVLKVTVPTPSGGESELTLPDDLGALARLAVARDVAMILLDPLMSRLGKIDTHKDAEVRTALEPLAAMARACGAAVLGIIHPRKSGTGDPVAAVMGSTGFTAVARSVLSVERADGEDETQRVLGVAKSNYGPESDGTSLGVPLLAFAVTTAVVETDDGPAEIGAVTWSGEAAGSLRDATEAAAEGRGGRPPAVRTEAAEWLRDVLTEAGGSLPAATVRKLLRGSGLDVSESTLKRAARGMSVRFVRETDGSGGTTWALPDPVTPAEIHSPLSVFGEDE